jgi:hypothetical protein
VIGGGTGGSSFAGAAGVASGGTAGTVASGGSAGGAGTDAGGTASGGSAGTVASGGSAGEGDGGTDAGGTASGGSAGTVASGGTAGEGGGGTGAGGTASGGSSGSGGSGTCNNKRGFAAVLSVSSAAADLAALSAPTPGVSWFYGWSKTPNNQVGTSYVAAGVEWVPMVWGHQDELSDSDLASKIHVGANTKYLLGYNEPNFHSQANLTPAVAAAGWPYLEAAADELGLETVGPAMNFCGPAGSCNQVDPFIWLDQFLAACSGCRIDYVAFHSYACESNWFLNTYMAQAVQKYYTNGNPPRKIWLTEFACADAAPQGGWTVSQIQAYQNTVIPWLENEPAIFRYAWFGDTTGRPNDPNYVTASNALLAGAGQLTALGNTYTTLSGTNCP